MEGVLLSTFSTSKGSDWNYRIIETRSILIKARNDRMRRGVAIDLSLDLPFAFEISPDVAMNEVKVERRFMATLKVYTLKSVEDLADEFVEFFKVLDVDQSFEAFVKAYWMYPNYISFELTKIEPM